MIADDGVIMARIVQVSPRFFQGTVRCHQLNLQWKQLLLLPYRQWTLINFAILFSKYSRTMLRCATDSDSPTACHVWATTLFGMRYDGRYHGDALAHYSSFKHFWTRHQTASWCDLVFLRRSAYYIKHHLKKKLPSFLGTPYLVTKLRIKSEHFSANPNQILPNAHDYFSSSQRNAVVQCCSYIQQRLKKTCNTLCARWQMMANGVIQGSARRRQLMQLVRLEVKSDASLHRSWWSPDMSIHVWVTLAFMVDAYSNVVVYMICQIPLKDPIKNVTICGFVTSFGRSPRYQLS